MITEKSHGCAITEPAPGTRQHTAPEQKSKGKHHGSAARTSLCFYPERFQARIGLFMLKLSEKLEGCGVGGFFFFLFQETLRMHSPEPSFLHRHSLKTNSLRRRLLSPALPSSSGPDSGVRLPPPDPAPAPPGHGVGPVRFFTDFLMISSRWEDREGGLPSRVVISPKNS